MPTWLKILLAIFVVLIAFAVTGIFFAFRYVRDNTANFEQNSKKAVAEGRAFGLGKDANACVTEALNRGDKCGAMGVFCQANTTFFMSSCMEVAARPPDFCTSVPRRTNNPFENARWIKSECARRGHPNEQSCSFLIQTLQNVCEKSR